MTTQTEHYEPARERAATGTREALHALKGSSFGTVAQAAYTRLTQSESKARQAVARLESHVEDLTSDTDVALYANPDGLRTVAHRKLAETEKETAELLDEADRAADAFDSAMFAAALPAVPSGTSDTAKSAAQDRVFRRFSAVKGADLDQAMIRTARELAAAGNHVDLGTLVDVAPVLYAQAGVEDPDLKVARTLILEAAADHLDGPQAAALKAYRYNRGRNGAQGKAITARHLVYDQLRDLREVVESWRTPEEKRRADFEDRLHQITASQQNQAAQARTKTRGKK